MTMMSDQIGMARFICKQNIERYERLLRGSLTELERSFVERRLAEEKQALQKNIRGIVGEALVASKVLAAAAMSNFVDFCGSAFDLLDQAII